MITTAGCLSAWVAPVLDSDAYLGDWVVMISSGDSKDVRFKSSVSAILCFNQNPIKSCCKGGIPLAESYTRPNLQCREGTI